MSPLEPGKVLSALQKWIGQAVFVHLEVNPGAYWRNGSAVLEAIHVKGDGPFRIFLEFDGKQGLIQVDDLTHMLVSPDAVICTGYDSQDRLARTVEVSPRPFDMSSTL